ncbi:hypothetical protein AMATHDRAFT_70410 [Amanita thiersii Skay4041]|uniref:F-box domain-containing protein n=1 Tax=Amanita thiersii Skay4041 TaxID=703135 RepID=A0A2A9ND48_9AGAR|nr:hypothetical protein AMATHDRAFT_70410 [Amanita thiersii Skay4041]
MEGKSLDEDGLDDEDNQDRCNIPFEILITHINSHFRRIAIGTRVLWSVISISPTISLNKVITYIERSAGCMLDVRVDLPPNSVVDKGLRRMIELALSHSSRWRTFSYVSDQEAREGMLSCLADIDAPALEHLSLNVEDVHRDNINTVNLSSTIHTTLFKKGTPKLYFLRLRGYAIHSFIPPLASVRVLHLDLTKSLALQYPKFRELVLAPMALEHLSVYGNSSSWPNETIIQMPNLQSLRICDIGGRAYAGVLLGFDAPLLETLALKGVQVHDLDRVWTCTTSLKFSKLQRLIFWDFGLLERDWRHAFRLFPLIADFSMYSPAHNATILRLLAESNTYDLPWPCLKSLSFIANTEDSDEEQELIYRLIAARQSCGHPLDVIRLGANWEKHSTPLDGTPQVSTRIEMLQHLDRWPPDRGYYDLNDDLFL